MGATHFSSDAYRFHWFSTWLDQRWMAHRRTELYLMNIGPVYSRAEKNSICETGCSPTICNLLSICAHSNVNAVCGKGRRVCPCVELFSD
eukprot:201158-Prymnesium_polylepis.1